MTVDLETLLAIANSRHGPGGHHGARTTAEGPEHDHLVVAEDAVRFLVDHGVGVPVEPPSVAHLASLREIQRAARRLAEGDEAAWANQTRGLLGRARYRLSLDGRPEPTARGWDGLIEALLPQLLELRSRRDLLRICGNGSCRWLFLDRSRNRSRRWCEMAACGNRAKVRRYRGRLAGLASRTGRVSRRGSETGSAGSARPSVPR